MSISASVLILIAVLLRRLLRRSPKWILCLLWGLVAVRLVCPVSVESSFSLAPQADFVEAKFGMQREGGRYLNSAADINKAPNDNSDDAQNKNLANNGNTDRQSDWKKAGNTIDSDANTAPVSATAKGTNNHASVWKNVGILSSVWLVGAVVLLTYAAISYLRFRKKVQASVRIRDGIYMCDNIRTPFILGVIRPGIYLPTDMDEVQTENVIAHERAHLSRLDQVWKPLGYGLLAVYWFNPLCWLAYILFCHDIELACDEKVIRNMGTEEKKIYSRVLLSFSDPSHRIAACPLAFGEVGVKQRIQSVLNYRKPAFWMVGIAIVVLVVTSICFLTNPKAAANDNVPNTESNDNISNTEVTAETNVSGTQGADVTKIQNTESIHNEYNQNDIDMGILGDAINNSGGIQNAYSWEEAGTLQPDTDALVELAVDETGEFGIYGIMSKAYGTYGLLLNDTIDGEENWNFAFVPWISSGKPNEKPQLAAIEKGNSYYFRYVSGYDEDGFALWSEYKLVCGFDTGHMELEQFDGNDDLTIFTPNVYKVGSEASCADYEISAGYVQKFNTADDWGTMKDGKIEQVYLDNHLSRVEDCGPIDGLCAPGYLVKIDCDLYSAAALEKEKNKGTDMSEIDTTGQYWLLYLVRENEDIGYILALNTKNYTKEDVLTWAQGFQF